MWCYLVGVTDTRQRESYTVVKGRRYVARLELLQRGLEKPLHKGVKVEPKFQWRAKNIGDSRITNHLPWKAMGIECFQPKREGMLQ